MRRRHLPSKGWGFRLRRLLPVKMVIASSFRLLSSLGENRRFYKFPSTSPKNTRDSFRTGHELSPREFLSRSKKSQNRNLICQAALRLYGIKTKKEMDYEKHSSMYRCDYRG